MTLSALQDRAAGAMLGMLIGDALGVGPHWYYDLDQLKDDYGPWISDYTAPKLGRYHAGLRPGEGSQTGQVAGLLLASVAAQGRYVQDDFTSRLDDLLETLDGSPSGGRYTDQAMRDIWHSRHGGLPWGSVGSFADTAEAALRAPVLAAAYAGQPDGCLRVLVENLELTHRDPFILGQSVAFGLIVCALVRGVALKDVSQTVPRWNRDYSLEFRTTINWQGPGGRTLSAEAPYVDALLQPGWACQAAQDLAIRVEPAAAVCRLFGMACSLGFMLPAAYYLSARFPGDFEQPVLHALNGGGNNMARAALTGAIAGAQVGLSGIPQRFIKGLAGHEVLLAQAKKVAALTG